jgi:ribosomal protein S18 acetylase RimI-like enzyme
VPDIALRPARPDDADRIQELHTASVRTLCRGHYAPHIIDGWLAGRSASGYLSAIEQGVLFVAERNDRVVGFGHYAPGAVIAIFVDPAASRRGVGRALLDHAMAHARVGWSGPVRLEATLNAREFYEAAGFREVGQSTTRRNDVEIPTIVMESRAS